MIIRLLAFLYVVLITIINVPFLLIAIFSVVFYPTIYWIYWIITGSKIIFGKYFPNVAFLPMILMEKTKIDKKVKQILGWEE